MLEFIDFTSNWEQFRRLLACGKGVDLRTFDGLAIKDSRALFTESRKSVIVSIYERKDENEGLILRHAQTARTRICVPSAGVELRQVLRVYERGRVPGTEDFAIRETKESRLQSAIDCAVQGLLQEFRQKDKSIWEKIGFVPTPSDLIPHRRPSDIRIRRSSVYPKDLVVSAETAEWFTLNLSAKLFRALVMLCFSGNTLIITDKDGMTGEYRHWAEIHLKCFPYDKSVPR